MNSPDPPLGDEAGLGDGTEPPSDDLLAGEFVLGVLDAAERRAVQVRIDLDREFALRVADWERRLAPWLDAIEPIEAPPRVWERIRMDLGWRDIAPARVSFWESVRLWRAATVVSLLIAVAAVVWVGQRLQRPVAPPVATNIVTPLAHDDGTPGWLASVDPVQGTVLVVPVPTAPDAQGRVPELWLIPAGKAPRSLGRVWIDKTDTVHVPADVRAALVAGSVLAVSLEPATGIPHAAPTGPIVAKGAIQAPTT
jgi:anti-sigma-K factor RskA